MGPKRALIGLKIVGALPCRASTPQTFYPSPARSASTRASRPHSSSVYVLEASRSAPCGQAAVVSARKPRMAFVALGSPNSRSCGAFSAEGILAPAFRKALAMFSLGLRHSPHSNKRWRTDSLGAWHPYHLFDSLAPILCRSMAQSQRAPI
jgi:hypothetical protein